jgi:hypothetical protein
LKLLKTFFRLPLKLKLTIPRVFVLMAYYKYLVHHRPFSELAPKIGTLGYETPLQTTTRDARAFHELMEAMFRRIKWKDSCLIRALTAKRILNSMGEKCTLYMGVSKKEGQGMTAHAWLRCGKCIVTGADSMAGYTVTAIFGDQ